jgi:hypothetical protein
MRSDDRRPGSGGHPDRAVPHGTDEQYRFALIQGASQREHSRLHESRCDASRRMRTGERVANCGSSLNRSRSFRFTMSNSPSRSRGACLRPGFATLLRSPESRGGRSAERRSGARRNTRAARHNAACQALARRLASHSASKTRVNALMTRDARLSALHRGGFGLPGPRFRLLGRPTVLQRRAIAFRSVQRAPRSQVVVPGGRGPCLPRRAVTSRRRRTPRLPPHSGSSLEHALNERGWQSYNIASSGSQEINSICSCEISAKCHAAFDHLVRGGLQRQRNDQAGLRGLEVDHQLEFGRLLDRQVGWRRALERA